MGEIDMEIKYTLSKIKYQLNSIFLAGPTYRIDGKSDVKKSWRSEVIQILKNKNFNGTVYVPEYAENNLPNGWTYEKQVDWEMAAMKSADVILFWIPRDLIKLPAFTTNIEFGEQLYSGKIVIGSPDGSPKNEYIKYRCKKQNISWHNNLIDLVSSTLYKLSQKEKSNVWFTSDTHFGQKRTLDLSKRPFNSVEDMDSNLIRNWNSVVTNNDIIYHLGDFGNPDIISELKGRSIYFVPGNYDTEDVLKKICFDQRVNILNNNCTEIIDGTKFKMVHIPCKALDSNSFYLYGHIHGRQMVKRNGLDVGVDCHNFKPISLETVRFYKNAILKFYDKNVFIDHLG